MCFNLDGLQQPSLHFLFKPDADDARSLVCASFPVILVLSVHVLLGVCDDYVVSQSVWT
jgi:hypothetical protein